MSGTLHVIGTRKFLRALGVGHHGVQRGILAPLSARPGAVIDRDHITDWLWGGDENGGPLDPKNSIRVAVLRLRRKGVAITTHSHRRGYSIEARP